MGRGRGRGGGGECYINIYRGQDRGGAGSVFPSPSCQPSGIEFYPHPQTLPPSPH